MWLEIGVVALLLCGVSAFRQRAGWRRMLTRWTGRWAKDIYGHVADSPRKRQLVMERGGLAGSPR